jgi:AcrR family transcriptional regulator
MTHPPPQDASAKPRRRYAPRMAPAQRREQLLDAALNVIVQQGYEGVSIEAVARTAGVTRPVIYDHFPNLGSLLRALIEREEALALEQLSSVVPESPREGDPPVQLAAGVRRFLDGVASRPNTWRIILLPPEGTPGIVRDQVEINRATLLDRMERFVRLAAQEQQIPADLDTEICARAVLRLSEEAGRMVLTDPRRFSPERYERFALALLELIWEER